MRISPEIVAEMVEEARKCAPMEACGLLAGKGDVIEKHYPMTNVDASAEHFSLDPKEQFAAAKDMRSCGLDMLAVYHSHPATPARMSEEDKRLAFTPGIRYVIISLVDAQRPEIRSFRMNGSEPVEDPVEIG